MVLAPVLRRLNPVDSAAIKFVAVRFIAIVAVFTAVTPIAFAAEAHESAAVLAAEAPVSTGALVDEAEAPAWASALADEAEAPVSAAALVDEVEAPVSAAALIDEAALPVDATIQSAEDAVATGSVLDVHPATNISQLRPAEQGEAVSIWHIPHPDDETIGMAGGIMADAAAGRRNIIIMYTNGESSDVRFVLNGFVRSRLHGRRLNPAADGYEPLDRTALGHARVREAVAALAWLGVEPDDIWLVGLPDGGVTVDAALDVIHALDERYPHAAHRTTSLSDPHPDHRSLARALYIFRDKRRSAGTPPDVRFYSVYTYGRQPEHRTRGLEKVRVANPDAKARALAEYGVWAPSEGRFAIGMLSVPRLLARAATDPFEYVEPIPHVLSARHTLRHRVDVTIFQDKAVLHMALGRGLQLRFGVTFSGSVPPPALVYEAPAALNAVKFRFGVAPTDWRLSGVRASLAGLALFDRFLVEYEPSLSHAGSGSLRVGWRIRL